jgi:CRP/FNR family cyclic AMP-dependent transcriptional regulator
MTVTSSVSTIALRTFPIFQGLGDDRLAAVARCAMMRRVPRGPRWYMRVTAPISSISF